MPCLIELGGAATKVHEAIGRKIAQICDLAIITNSDYYNDIKNGATLAGMDIKNILFIKDANLILEKIGSFCTKDDTILLEGRIQENITIRIKKGV